MRIPRFVVLLVLFTFAKSALAQQAPASAPQAIALLQQSLTALTGGRPLTDVTLSGTAERIAGSDDESGTVIVKALVGTGIRLDLSLPSGPRTEIRNASSDPIVGSWSDPDGSVHSESYHNLLTDPAWIPAFTIAGLLGAQTPSIADVGPETRDGKPVVHIIASHQPAGFSASAAVLMQHLTQTDVFLDPGTYLPTAIAFNIHPDDNANLDIPVEIRYSDYRPVNGAQVPFHVQKFINNSLYLDLQFDSVVLNSGLPPADFQVAGLQTGSSHQHASAAANLKFASGVTR